MRAWSVLRQLLAATLCAVLALPACSSIAPLSSSTPSHIYDAATLSKTRVWGSNEKILLHFRAVLLVSEKQHWGSAKCSCKNVLGSLVTYDYDAFGNLIHSTGSTLNNYLYSGEQFDPDLNLYFNRARYLNVSTGRFWTMDSFEGHYGEPLSLHLYLYVTADPTNRTDRSGHDGDINSETTGLAGQQTVGAITTISRLTVQFLVRRILTVSAYLGAGFFIFSNPEFDTEVQAGGQEAITVVQNAFMEAQTVITEAQAEQSSIWNTYGTLRNYFNELFTGSSALNPPNIEYHHIVEQAEEEINDFAPNAINSAANVVPTPSGVHAAISNFYGTAQPWLQGISVRAWMAGQTWDVQWREGLEIWKQAMTGNITWRPPF